MLIHLHSFHKLLSRQCYEGSLVFIDIDIAMIYYIEHMLHIIYRIYKANFESVISSELFQRDAAS